MLGASGSLIFMVVLGMGFGILEHPVQSLFLLFMRMKEFAGAGLSSGWLRILPDMEGFRLMWGGVCRTDDCVWVFI